LLIPAVHGRSGGLKYRRCVSAATREITFMLSRSAGGLFDSSKQSNFLAGRRAWWVRRVRAPLLHLMAFRTGWQRGEDGVALVRHWRATRKNQKRAIAPLGF
jgi:hypothetical protein